MRAPTPCWGWGTQKLTLTPLPPQGRGGGGATARQGQAQTWRPVHRGQPRLTPTAMPPGDLHSIEQGLWFCKRRGQGLPFPPVDTYPPPDSWGTAQMPSPVALPQWHARLWLRSALGRPQPGGEGLGRTPHSATRTVPTAWPSQARLHLARPPLPVTGLCCLEPRFQVCPGPHSEAAISTRGRLPESLRLPLCERAGEHFLGLSTAWAHPALSPKFKPIHFHWNHPPKPPHATTCQPPICPLTRPEDCFTTV